MVDIIHSGAASTRYSVGLTIGGAGDAASSKLERGGVFQMEEKRANYEHPYRRRHVYQMEIGTRVQKRMLPIGSEQ